MIERIAKQGETYFVVRDYGKLRVLFGQLLREVQRIKSQGDYQAGRDLIEHYGVKIDPVLHREVLGRYATLNIPQFAGFIPAKLEPVMVGDRLVDVKLSYPRDFTARMLELGKRYGFLPVTN